MPLVSVVLTSFNHAAYLRDAIDSVLDQTFQDFELIIWDDASSDNSWEIIDSYSDSRIKAFRNPQNLGPAYGVDYAIKSIATGDFVAIHHSDDVWVKNKLEKQLAVYAEHPELGAVFTDAFAIGERGEPLEDANHFYTTAFTQPNRSRFEWIRYFIEYGNALCHPSLLIRAQCYRECGVYADYYGQAPDFDMWFRLVLRHEIHVMPEKLVKFRVRASEVNTSGSRPETRRQWSYESFAVLQNLLKIDAFEDLCRIFPEAAKYDRGSETNLNFALALALLETTERSPMQLFALELIRSILVDPERANHLRNVYNFDGNSFVALSKECDVFSLERLREIKHQLDLQADDLNNQTHEREILKQVVRDLNYAVVSYRDSLSWRITKPLRELRGHARQIVQRLGRSNLLPFVRGDKWKRSVSLQTGLFDSAYYLHENQDVRISGLNPIDHYFAQGWREGRNPSRKFSVSSYFEKNPDVRWADEEPLGHFLTKGQKEGRLASTVDGEVLYVSLPPSVFKLLSKAFHFAKSNPDLLLKFAREMRRGGIRYALSLVKAKIKGEAFGNISRLTQVVDQNSRNAVIHDRLHVVPFYTNPYDHRTEVALAGSTVAVHLHLYYQDMLDLCVCYLRHLPIEFDLFVSVPESLEIESVREKFRTTLINVRNIYIEPVPNRGRDISPLIVQFGQRLLGYDYVAHFHTKKSPHATSLNSWFEDIMTQLCGSSAQIAQIFRLLQGDAKIVYPAGNQVAAWDQTGWSDNKDVARYLLKSYTTLDVDDFPYVEFPQGSMFWAKSGALTEFLGMPLRYADFPEEPIEADATIAHALERLILILASNAPGRAYRLESEALSATPQEYFETQQDYSETITHKSIKVLAYYLPQFHPTRENDEWHGVGFTEWHKVAAANPLFVGHYQQHIPHPDIGYYHLESGDQLKKQAQLMHKAGVHGMIFYHYWFAGRLILEKPAQMLLADPSIEMPFCFCWANENWTRRWDGNEQEILLGQNYSPEDAREFICYLIPFFKDQRYIKVEGRPVLFVYRPSSMEAHCTQYLSAWAEECVRQGVPIPYVVATLTRGANNPDQFGMDAAVERVLHDWTGGSVPDIRDTLRPYWPLNGSVLDYQDVARHYMEKSVDRSFIHFRSLVPVWDNTARYGSQAYLLKDFNPRVMQTWLERLIVETEQCLPEDRQFIILNAWNEWAEGAHLEPDTRFGYAYLNVIGRALSGLSFNETNCLKNDCKIINLCLEPQVIERLSQDRVLRAAFVSCLNQSAEKTGVGFASEMPEHQKALTKLGIDCESIGHGLAEFSWVFKEVMLFPDDTLASMLLMAARHQGFYICGNLLNHPAFVSPPALTNFSIGYWERSGMELRPTKIRLGYKVCPKASCFRVAAKSNYSTGSFRYRKVATIIRFHSRGDVRQLVNALFCLISQADCHVQPWLALQDLSDQEFDNLRAMIDRLPWSEGCAPIYRRYSSSTENPDLRSKMLNETLKAVGSGYLAFLDYDDVLYPEAYAYLVSRLEKTEKNAAFGRVYSTTVSEDGLVTKREVEFIAGHKFEDFLLRNHAPLHSFMLNLDRIDVAAIVYHPEMKYMEDYFLTLQIFGEDRTDWDSLNEERFLGDYTHRQGCDNHTLALADKSEKKALLESEIYMICETRIVEMRRKAMMAVSMP